MLQRLKLLQPKSAWEARDAIVRNLIKSFGMNYKSW